MAKKGQKKQQLECFFCGKRVDPKTLRCRKCGKEHFRCYYCDKLVKPSALKCPYCRKWYSSGKRTILTAVLVTVIAIIVVVGVSSLMTGQERGKGEFDFNTDDWIVDDEISVPEYNPDLRGQVLETGGDFFVFQTMVDRQTIGDSVTIRMDDGTQIFWMSRVDSTVTKGSKSDVQPGSPLMVWGTQHSDGSWIATHIGLIQRG